MAPGDEGRHPPELTEDWHEAWTFDIWTPDGARGASTALVLWPHRRRAWYWCTVVRSGRPLVHLADLDVPLPRTGLELRTHGLWAMHECEAPFEQWTVANEAYAVALEDPSDALGRALGTPTPVALDLDWYAAGAPVPLDGRELAGYRQAGEAHGSIELAEGPLDLEARASRAHWWGTGDPWPPPDDGWPPPGLHAPIRLGDTALERVLTADGEGWREARRPA